MKLGDICSKIGSGATPRGGKDSYKDSGTAIIRSQNVLDWSFSSSGLAFIDDDQSKALSNVEVKQGDVLLNITGDSVARLYGSIRILARQGKSACGYYPGK